MKRRATRGKVREIHKDGIHVHVIYGIYMDRAYVSITSCSFICHGELSELDKNDENLYVFT